MRPDRGMEEAVIHLAAMHTHEDPELDALRVALALEDVIDVVLGDEWLDPAILCDPVAVTRVLEDPS